MSDQECVAKLVDRDSSAMDARASWPRRCMWYALLFHRLIDAMPPGGILEGVRSLIERCMVEPDDWDPVNCRVAWLPHTHHLFPDAFKVSSVQDVVVAWVDSTLPASRDDVPAVCQERLHDDATRHPPNDCCTIGSC
jgi:hypothetical protein